MKIHIGRRPFQLETVVWTKVAHLKRGKTGHCRRCAKGATSPSLWQKLKIVDGHLKISTGVCAASSRNLFFNFSSSSSGKWKWHYATGSFWFWVFEGSSHSLRGCFNFLGDRIPATEAEGRGEYLLLLVQSKETLLVVLHRLLLGFCTARLPCEERQVCY